MRADLRALPGHLDRVDGWIADGVIGGEQPNAADLQIGATIALMLTIGDLAPLIEGRPAERPRAAAVPEWAGDVPAGVLPAALAPAPSAGSGRRPCRLTEVRIRSAQLVGPVLGRNVRAPGDLGHAARRG